MNSSTAEGETSSSSNSVQPCRIFSLAEIHSATKFFDDELVVGEGGFGKVYKGLISGEEAGKLVAIKRTDSMSNQGELEFRAEIDMLSKLRHCHCHLVSLICHENKEMILVYEFIPNGTLYHHLHKANAPLSWLTRLKIAIGAARGLEYLHFSGVIHRDVKSSNILLDENWTAMISDFGMSKIGSTNQPISYADASVKGTFGYLDPEYYYTRKLTRKSDVYSFGVVLFELLTRRLAVDERNEEDHYSLVRWAQRCLKERKLDQIIDSNIKGTISAKCLRRFAKIAYRCVHSDPKERPTMTEVVFVLQALLELLENSNHHDESSGVVGFTWKIHKYFGSPTTSDIRDVKIFTYEELKLATRDFGSDRFLGEGRYGTVYKGWITVDNTKLPIAVRELHPYTRFDLDVLKYFHHSNIVKPIGYCLKGAQIFLVYEFMSNGMSLNLLNSGLPLVTKVKIVVGIARGLVFLHNTLSKKIWPRFSESPLYRHNIFLDEDYTAKLSDYDVSIFVGIPPRIPNICIDGCIELLSNPIFYGVVFLEVLTGHQIIYLDKLRMIESFFIQCGKESLLHIAELCYNICNEVDSESKMLTMLEEYDKLIQERLSDWLRNTKSVDSSSVKF